MTDWLVEIAEARASLAGSAEPYVQPFTHGSMRCVLFQPKSVDEQTPHTQDEFYLITSGSGSFERDGQRIDFMQGDAIFVPADMAHRFVDFSNDFECWAIFWGPKGGEG